MNQNQNIRNSQRIVVELRKLLADSYFIYLKAQKCHWNVTGKNFIVLHSFFEEIYTELQENIDEIAERIRALGEFSPGSFQEFQALSKVEEITDLNLNSSDMLQIIRDDYIYLTKNIHDILVSIDDTNDEASKDMLVEMLRDYEKRLWMIQSQLHS